MMGAQGWQLLYERGASHGRMQWIAAALRDAKIVPDSYEATEFVMMREVRD